MLRHIVLFRLREESAARIEELMAELQSLEGKIPGILEFQVIRDEINSERSASFGLMSLFDDREALRRYQQHPEHQAWTRLVGPLCEWIRAWDYTVDS